MRLKYVTAALSALPKTSYRSPIPDQFLIEHTNIHSELFLFPLFFTFPARLFEEGLMGQGPGPGPGPGPAGAQGQRRLSR